MSRIDSLISEHCPSGVKFEMLGDIARTVPGLSGKTKTDFSGGNARYVSYMNVFRNLSVDQNSLDFVSIGPDERQNRLREGDVVFTGSSESLEEVGMSSVVLSEPVEALYLNSFCFALRFEDSSRLLAAFSKYLFRGESMREQIMATASGVTRINIAKSRFLNIRIPVPPLQVQLEIVRILDEFSSLEAELEAELKARRLQCEHYQRIIFDDLEALGVTSRPLREVGRWFGGGTPSKARPEYWTGGTIPWISPKDMGGTTVFDTQDHITEAAVAESSTKLVPGNAVAIVVRSSILNHTLPIAYVPAQSALNQDVKAVIASEGIMPRYLFHVLRASRSQILREVKRTGGSVASLDSLKLSTFEVPIPGQADQTQICRLFDQFDALENDLSVGLPAELAARRKQYEHYRDRLLTFAEAAA